MANPQKQMLLLPLVILSMAVAVSSQLSVGFYAQSCPNAEQIVLNAVVNAYSNNSGIAPGLIRMHFHDCFVRGCEGSVLLDSTTGNRSEKEAIPNNPSLRGFEVIDAAKAALEAACPRTVSCADVLAFAARDSATVSGGIFYPVPAGRRDGRVSIENEALTQLPAPNFNATQLVNNFALKNLTAEDMVTLSGAHSLGRSHCGAFVTRLYNFNNVTNATDPTLDPAYAALLKTKCPANSTLSDPFVVPLDALTPNVLDNMYYAGLKSNLGLLTSDHALVTNSTLAGMVDSNVLFPSPWPGKFAAAMVKMGGIQVLTGTQGEIRTNCRVVNPTSTSSIKKSIRETMFISELAIF
ncbi:peroxidase 5-like [Aristolochia californica]|uniref:peroxidase 5-like n=1 Tax=Aristolochia californica TaxID=171875 RepID=UPI0035E3127B